MLAKCQMLCTGWTRYLTVSKTEIARNTLYTRDCVKLLITRRHSLDVHEDQFIGICGVVFRVNAFSMDCRQSITSLLHVPTVAAIGLTCILRHNPPILGSQSSSILADRIGPMASMRSLSPSSCFGGAPSCGGDFFLVQLRGCKHRPAMGCESRSRMVQVVASHC